MKFAAAAVLLSGLVAANPLPQPSTMLGHMIMRRDTVDYAEFVPEPCKELCRVNNGLYTEWEAKNCNKEVTDDCNKTMCKVSMRGEVSSGSESGSESGSVPGIERPQPNQKCHRGRSRAYC